MHHLRSLLFALLGMVAAPAFAQQAPTLELTDDQSAEAMDFAMHDAIYTLYHESGHLLIHELGLPVLGKEEDAADALGVILIFKNTTDDDELYNTLNDVADGWYWSAEETTGNGVDDLSYYDEHSLDIQRSYAVVCMMVGHTPAEFKEVADDFGIGSDQQEGCAGTYQQAESSWSTVLAPHLATSPGPEIPVIYEDPGDFKVYEDELKSRHILESLAEYLRANFVLPNPISIHASICGEPNAYYQGDDHRITYCYELADDVFQRAAVNLFGPDSEASDDEESSE